MSHKSLLADEGNSKTQDVEPPAKRPKFDADEALEKDSRLSNGHVDGRQKGMARVKKEFRVSDDNPRDAPSNVIDDDAAEAMDYASQGVKSSSRQEKQRGQNKGRDFGFSMDTKTLCPSRIHRPEMSPRECKHKNCKHEHDLRKYLADFKRPDLETFGGKCPVLEARGKCDLGWKCRFVGSHSRERETSEGKKELVLLDSDGLEIEGDADQKFESYPGVSNNIPSEIRFQLERKKFNFDKSDKIVSCLEEQQDLNLTSEIKRSESIQENRAAYLDSRLLPSEKRRLYYGPETPVLAPLTTQGNLPFRRLCVSLGAQVTWSEMAMSLPLIQGLKAEWALVRSHESENSPPDFQPVDPVQNYVHTKDTKFGVQIAGNKPALAIRAAEVLTAVCPFLRAIDLNCGCPIDMVYQQGAGSALLDSPGRLEKILRGMNAVSGEVPITVKIRTGTKDNKPTAQRLINRLVFGEVENSTPTRPCGVAAITLHGRSRQQRYTKRADWSYIAECAALIKSHREKRDSLTDTINEPEARDKAASAVANGDVYFLGNGDIYSHEDYFQHIKETGVSSCMIARGALIKPWIFEEISSGQHLDKSSSERLEYIETFCRNGLEYWGSDEFGIGYTRRFLLEWLSFAYRYVPVGIVEHLPPSLQERPEKWKGRDDLETLLGSDNYKDWIKISEMFLGKANESFKFIPKHKSNAYEDAEG